MGRWKSPALALQALFKIMPGEGPTVGLLVALMLSAQAGSGVGSSGIQALFFARLGVELLPAMYVVVGVVTILFTLGLAALLSATTPTRIHGVLPLVLAACLVGARVLLLFDPLWLYPVLWVFSSVMLSVQGVFTWGLAAAVCDTRQAKRVFPLVNAGGILGAVAGGLATAPLAARLGADNLVLVWAIGSLVAYGLGRAVIGRAPPPPPRPLAQPVHPVAEMRATLRFICRSALLSWMALAVATYFVLVYLLGFPFAAEATAHFSGADALAGFFGVFQATSIGVAFLSSVFLAHRLFARFGIMSVLLSFAVVCLVGFGALVLDSAFPVLVAFRFVQIALVAGLVITAFQAVFNIAPPGRRDQIRAFVAGGPGQVGIIATGLVLGLGSQVLQPRDLYVLGLVVGVVATYCTWQAKRAYRGALIDALRAGQPALFVEDESFGGLQRDAAAIAVVVAGASDRDAITRRTSVEILGQLGVAEGTSVLVRALDDPDGPVRVAALRALAATRAVSALPLVTAHLADPEPDVRRQAIMTLSELDGEHARVATRARALMSDPEVTVRAVAAQVVLCRGPDAEAWQTLVAMASASDPESRALAVETIGDAGVAASRDRDEVVARSLADPAPVVRAAAAETLGRIAGESSVEALVLVLGDEDALVRRSAAEALGQVGTAALQPVVGGLSDPALEAGALLALEHLAADGAAATIRDYARARVTRAVHCVELWQSLGGDASDERQLLLDSLMDEARRRGTCALRALATLGDRTTITLALDGLNSRDPAHRANALEALENLAERTLVRPLIRVWETPAAANESDGALVDAMQDSDPWIRACAAVAAGAASRGGIAMDTLPAVSLMERVVFLRRVPLFASLAPIEVKQVAAIAGERVYADGEVLTRQGDAGEQLYVIVAGEVRVLVTRGDGVTVEAVRRTVGEYVGEMAILTQESRIATLIAVGTVRVLTIDQKAFERILLERPETGLAVIRELCTRLKESETRTTETAC